MLRQRIRNQRAVTPRRLVMALSSLVAFVTLGALALQFMVHAMADAIFAVVTAVGGIIFAAVTVVLPIL